MACDMRSERRPWSTTQSTDYETVVTTHRRTTMASVATYLNFARETEEACNCEMSVIGTEFMGDIVRFGDTPGPDGQPMPKDNPDRNLIMHMTLPILGGHLLMGTDAPESMG